MAHACCIHATFGLASLPGLVPISRSRYAQHALHVSLKRLTNRHMRPQDAWRLSKAIRTSNSWLGEGFSSIPALRERLVIKMKQKLRFGFIGCGEIAAMTAASMQ